MITGESKYFSSFMVGFCDFINKFFWITELPRKYQHKEQYLNRKELCLNFGTKKVLLCWMMKKTPACWISLDFLYAKLFLTSERNLNFAKYLNLYEATSGECHFNISTRRKIDSFLLTKRTHKHLVVLFWFNYPN